MAQLLEGKVALITGGTSGIGLGIAKRFVSEGAEVYITGRRQPELDAAAKELGDKATAVRSDIASLANLDALYQTIAERSGHLDVVVANAGVGTWEPLGSITEAEVDRVFDINVKGTIFTVQKALPLLRPGASIIVLGSVTGSSGTAGISIYSATKAAVRNLVRTWILDVKDRDIRINVLSPGPIETPALYSFGAAGHEEETVAKFASTVPMGRVGSPDEIGRVALFLATDASSFVNGAELFADGGKAQV